MHGDSGHDALSGREKEIHEPIAVQLRSDMWAKRTDQVAIDYPGWEQNPLESFPDQYNRLDHWSYHLSKDDPEERRATRGHVVMINDREEHTIVADEGRVSQTPAPQARGKHPYEPENNPPDDPRTVHNPSIFEFFRNWHRKPGLSGNKLSLANNEVVLAIGGMRPNDRRAMRSTYRLEPEPWDLDIVDLPEDVVPTSSSPVTVQSVYSSRSYRLGG